MLRKIIAILGIAMLLCTFFVSTGTTFAANRPKPSFASNFSNLQKTCTIIDVELHGTQNPTFTCAQTKAKVGWTVSPHTQVVGCGTSANITTMEIDYGNGQAICYVGTGYMGASIAHATRVSSPNHTNGWVLYYAPSISGGWYCGLGGVWPGTWSHTFYQPVLITQVYPGNSTYKNCSFGPE